jgi:hypothetical protein
VTSGRGLSPLLLLSGLPLGLSIPGYLTTPSSDSWFYFEEFGWGEVGVKCASGSGG